MTITAFKRDIETRACCYASLGEDDKTLPFRAVLHISKVIVVETFPTIILFTDGVNKIQLTQIQSIELEDDHYKITCGMEEWNRTVCIVHIEPSSQ